MKKLPQTNSIIMKVSVTKRDIETMLISTFEILDDEFNYYKLYQTGPYLIIANSELDKIGVAKCNNSDNFNRDYGIALAFSRVTENKVMEQIIIQSRELFD